MSGSRHFVQQITTLIMSVKNTILIYLLLWFPLITFAQQTVRGVVIEENTQLPIQYATVLLQGGAAPVGGMTDSMGVFAIAGIAAGRYEIQVTMTGYEPYIQKEMAVGGGKEVVLSISLKKSAFALKEITIRAGVNKEQPINRMATVSARMLSVEEAARYAGGFDDPARLASAFAGVASNVGNNGIVIRGNAPKFLQWKMEGVEIPNPNHFADMAAFGGGGLTALSSQMLANSDFFTGAFPAEYSNALSGVFDIAMRTGNNRKREHTFQLGAIGIDAASEGPFGKNSKSSYLFNYRYSTLGLIAPLLPENAGGVRYQDFSFKLNFPTKKTGTFSLWGIGLKDGSGAKAKTDSTLWKYASDKEEQNVQQYMGAAGLTHKYFFSNNTTYLKTTLAATISGLDLSTERFNANMSLAPQNSINNQYGNFVLSSFVNRKFNSRHTNRTGVILTGLTYNQVIENAGTIPGVLTTIVNESGNSALAAAYTQSSVHITEKLTMNTGITGQLFLLNSRYTVEPRVGLKYQHNNKHSYGLAYGLHSRLERLNYYFTRTPATGNTLVNKDLDFTRAHHFVFSYDWNISKNIHLKAEPYFQQLYSVPVVAGSSVSFINMQNDWFFAEQLQNTGKGRNYGVDLTLEKYLTQGYYAMVTATAFRSEYLGGDGVWRDTRFNRNYVFNVLAGKEWSVGRGNMNTFGINARISYQGGDRYSPVNELASTIAKDVVFDETRAFSKQLPPALVGHFTTSYKINRKYAAHTIALKVINATMYKEFEGFRYNYQTGIVDESRSAIVVPNISYKIDF